jgi:hypothetical protein
MLDNEVPPPWSEYPGFPPGDMFWREAGQPWLVYVWEPFWKSLTPERQQDYLRRWNVPDVWRMFYFDSAFREWLDSVDEDS